MFAFVTLVKSFGNKTVPPLSMNRTDCRNVWGRRFTVILRIPGNNFFQKVHTRFITVPKVAAGFLPKQKCSGFPRAFRKPPFSGHYLRESCNAVSCTAISMGLFTTDTYIEK